MQVFHFFVSFFLSIIFHYNCEWNHLLNFSIEWLVCCVYKHNWFMCSNFVSCSFAEFISSSLFFFIVAGCFLCIWSCPLQAEVIFCFLFLTGMSFISYLIALNRISNTLLNEWQECLSLVCTRSLKGDFPSPPDPYKHFIKSDISCGLFIRAFIMLKYDHYLAILWRVFSHEWIINFVSWFFSSSIQNIQCFYLFCYVLYVPH